MVVPISELSQGLHKMTEAKVLHRDLTTDNVLVVRKMKEGLGKEPKAEASKMEEEEEKNE